VSVNTPCTAYTILVVFTKIPVFNVSFLYFQIKQKFVKSSLQKKNNSFQKTKETLKKQVGCCFEKKGFSQLW